MISKGFCVGGGLALDKIVFIVYSYVEHELFWLENRWLPQSQSITKLAALALFVPPVLSQVKSILTVLPFWHT